LIYVATRTWAVACPKRTISYGQRRGESESPPPKNGVVKRMMDDDDARLIIGLSCGIERGKYFYLYQIFLAYFVLWGVTHVFLKYSLFFIKKICFSVKTGLVLVYPIHPHIFTW